jgi:outer membrane protein assembly factor BamB
MVYCVDATTGKRIWQFQTEKQVFSSPAVVKGRVYVGEGLHTDVGCKVYCLDAATGRKLWAAPTRSHTESAPAVAGNRVFIGAGDDGVYSLDATSGKVVWHQRHGHIDTAPAVANGKVYVGTGYGTLRAMALEAATGRVLWETPCNLPVWGAPAVADGRVYFGIGNGDFVKSAPVPAGAVLCLDAATGKQLWRYDLPDAAVTSVVLTGDRALTGCRDGRVYALDRATGKPVWSADCGGPVVASPATDGALVYAAGGAGQLNALDVSSGKPVWALDLRAQTVPDLRLHSSPALSGSRLYLGTSSGKLFCIGR